MLTDRRARELLWPLYAMAFVIQDGVPKEQRDDPAYLRFMDRVKVAEAEIAGLHNKSAKEWDKVALSTMRAVGDAVEPYVKVDVEVGKSVLSCSTCFKCLSKQDILSIRKEAR